VISALSFLFSYVITRLIESVCNSVLIHFLLSSLLFPSISFPLPLCRRVTVSLDGWWVSPACFGWNRVFEHLSFTKSPVEQLPCPTPCRGSFCRAAGMGFCGVKVLIFGVKSGEVSRKRGLVNLRISTLEANT